jgi:ketosteroid isomerase-like protein
MAGILDSFQLLDHSIENIVIDGERAAVYWRGKFRAKATGQIGETDLVDVIELKDGRIVWMKSFFDTALAARLVGG